MIFFRKIQGQTFENIWELLEAELADRNSLSSLGLGKGAICVIDICKYSIFDAIKNLSSEPPTIIWEETGVLQCVLLCEPRWPPEGKLAGDFESWHKFSCRSNLRQTTKVSKYDYISALIKGRACGHVDPTKYETTKTNWCIGSMTDKEDISCTCWKKLNNKIIKKITGATSLMINTARQLSLSIEMGMDTICVLMLSNKLKAETKILFTGICIEEGHEQEWERAMDGDDSINCLAMPVCHIECGENATTMFDDENDETSDVDQIIVYHSIEGIHWLKQRVIVGMENTLGRAEAMESKNKNAQLVEQRCQEIRQRARAKIDLINENRYVNGQRNHKLHPLGLTCVWSTPKRNFLQRLADNYTGEITMFDGEVEFNKSEKWTTKLLKYTKINDEIYEASETASATFADTILSTLGVKNQSSAMLMSENVNKKIRAGKRELANKYRGVWLNVKHKATEYHKDQCMEKLFGNDDANKNEVQHVLWIASVTRTGDSVDIILLSKRENGKTYTPIALIKEWQGLDIMERLLSSEVAGLCFRENKIVPYCKGHMASNMDLLAKPGSGTTFESLDRTGVGHGFNCMHMIWKNIGWLNEENKMSYDWNNLIVLCSPAVAAIIAIAASKNNLLPQITFCSKWKNKTYRIADTKGNTIIESTNIIGHVVPDNFRLFANAGLLGIPANIGFMNVQQESSYIATGNLRGFSGEAVTDTIGIWEGYAE